MKMILRHLKTGLLLFAVICALSLGYELFVTLAAQVAAPDKANGSLLYVDGKVVGSELIGQSFTSPGYFHGRPSAVDYDGTNSGGSNYGPTSEQLMEQVKARVEAVRRENNLPPDQPIPADLVLASGSGLDPHISVDGAVLQVSSVAQARGLPPADVRMLVEQHIEPPDFGFIGQERVNVLKLNIALDELAKRKK
jgi:K+-transporting ATPase ATPase C chain